MEGKKRPRDHDETTNRPHFAHLRSTIFELERLVKPPTEDKKRPRDYDGTINEARLATSEG